MLDSINCPVEKLSLIEEQPRESKDQGVSIDQFENDLDLIEVKDRSITVDTELINE